MAGAAPDLSLDAVDSRARTVSLSVFGALHPEDLDGIGTLVLLGPCEPGFWPSFTASPEYRDGQSDAMDRWSSRVIGALAEELGATALFPFGGAPFHPFICWALESGRSWQSPVQLLVHDRAGLFASFRGALGFEARIALPPAPAAAPCDSCTDKPCLSACPAGALTARGYDVAACKSFLRTEAGRDCMAGGCRVRRACPVSREYGRLEAQSAFHMRAFL
ncbi:MAG: ferredoxin [Thalassovita sp.]|nr:ferredoxin [Thalassovita sp.]